MTKLITAILIITFTQASAAGYSQKISLNEKQSTLKTVLQKIGRQSGYRFLFADKMLDNARPVTVQLQDADLQTALDEVFRDQPLTFTIREKTIVVQEKQTPSLIDKVKAVFTSDPSHGRIVDENGQPLAGATVSIKGTSNSTVSDANGFFNLHDVPPHAVLVISFIGYDRKELPATAEVNTVKLELATSKLDEIQVIAYGRTSERLNTGNVSTVSAKEIAQQPVDNPLLALAGRVPGLFVTQATGVPGSGVTVLIRGQNSISSGNDPLYIIDGVPYPSLLLDNQGFILGSTGNGITGTQSMFGNPLSNLNPSDIESISVLKDASATAIYGSRAANGVILITTKKGKAGKTAFDINVQSGIGHLAHKADLLNTPQYLAMRNEALRNDGKTPSLSNGDYDLLLWDTTRYTDWQKELIGHTSHFTDAHASVSGGTTYTQFLIGADYSRQTTVFPGDFADQKSSVHFNFNHTTFDNKFNIVLTGSYMVQDNNLPYSDLTSNALTLAPDAPRLYNPDGTLNWAPNSTGTSTWLNPIAGLLGSYIDKTNNLVANAILSYQIIKGLKLSSSFGYNNLQSNDQALLPNSSVAPENRNIYQRYASFINNNINSWIVEPQLTYDRLMGKGKLSALLGSTIQQINSASQQDQALGQNSDLVLRDLDAASTIIGSSIASTYRYNAVFGRINYTWDDKYLVDLTARRDGSSRFGAANQFHDFGAVGLGWIFSKEHFLQDVLPALSFGKLRASYGTTGNDKIGDYKNLSLYNSTSVARAYQSTIGLTPAGLPNPNIQWELTRKMEIGLELGFLHDRILASASYSRNRSSNQLLAYGLPIITGFTSITSNFPATVQNTDWEFTLNTINLKHNSFRWNTSFNLTIPRNTLIAFPNIKTSTYANTLVVGQPITITKVYHFTGVDPTLGRYLFTSKTDPTNPKYTVDNTDIVNTSPKWYAGFDNTFSYKQFSLDILFQYVQNTGPNTLYALGDPGRFDANQFVSVLGRWQKPGDVTNIQRFNSTNSISTGVLDARSSNAGYSNDSWLRLKNLSLSWNLTPSAVRAMHLQGARIYVQGQNLLTFTKYKGLDPETTNTSGLPPLRVITGGIQLNL